MRALFFATPMVVGMTLVVMDFYGAALTRTSAYGFFIVFLNWLGLGFAVWRSSDSDTTDSTAMNSDKKV